MKKLLSVFSILFLISNLCFAFNFPRSTNPIHIKENFEIFDFELTEDEMNEIRKLDSGKRFFNMTLEQQEQMLGSWKPED